MASRILDRVFTVGGAVLNIFTHLFHVIFVPWRSSYEPIKSFLNVDENSKDSQTSSWRDRKLAELTFVGITCALVTGAVVQALTWSQAQTQSRLPFGFLYSSLVLSLVAICLAMQQSVALNRISSYRDYSIRIRSLLGRKLVLKDKDRGEIWVPRKLQLYVWQTPIMLLNFGILAFLIGLGIMVFENGNEAGGSSQGMIAVNGTALIILIFASGFAASNYVFSTGVLYHRIASIEG